MYKTTVLIYRYYTPLLCLLGAIGNTISLLVFCLDSKYRNQSAAWYLSALSVADTCYLFTTFLIWIEHFYEKVITTEFICPLIMYLGQVTCFFSVYLILAFSIERYIAVHFVFSRVGTPARAKKTIIILLLVPCLLFSYVWKIAKVVEVRESESLEVNNTQNNSTLLRCSVPQEYLKFSEIANYIDTFITLVIPFILICFTNLRIATFLRRRFYQGDIIPVESVNLDGASCSIEYQSRKLSEELTGCESNRQVLKTGSDLKKMSIASVSWSDYTCRRHSECVVTSEVKVTKTLLLVSTVFILLNLPLHVTRCAQFIYDFTVESSEKHNELLDTTQLWANMMFNTNFAVNFLLYCASGRNFRDSLKQIINSIHSKKI